MYTRLQLLLLVVWLVSAVSTNPDDCPVFCKCDITKHLVNCNSDYHGRRLLNTIPGDIPANTEILLLNNNNLSSIDNNALSNLPNLKAFSARNSMIVHIDSGAFKNLRTLRKIDLRRNKLHNFTLLHKLPVLSYLNLASNLINHYQNISLHQMPFLGTLDLSSNLIETSPLTKDFHWLRHLAAFMVNHNYLQKIDNTDLTPLGNSPLKNLSMNKCSLRNITRGALIHIRNVTRLDLGRNHLGIKLKAFENSMQALCSLFSLDYLNLYENKITHFTAETFKCLRNLKYLDLHRNYIMNLPANGFEGLISLVDLNLSMNKIRTINETALKGLHRLKRLTLSANRLINIPAHIFSSENNETYMPNIELINFSTNRIARLEKGNFKGLHNLRRLDIPRNEISALYDSDFEELHSLVHLTISANRLKRIQSKTFRPVNKTLVYLDIQSNRIGYKKSFSNYRFLKYIPRITALLLSNNKINRFIVKSLIPREMRKNLRRLTMRNMALNNVLPVGTFTGMYNLQKLDLSSNNIVSWDPKLFGNLPNLTTLWLSDNGIRKLNESSLGSVWYQLIYFRADHNPYACNCDLLWYINWIRMASSKHNVKDPTKFSHSYSCAFPKVMERKEILGYKPKNLECVAWWLIFLPSVTTFLVLLLLSTALGCWYRHHLRLCCFRNFGIGYKDYEAVDGEERDYDAFISYSQDDMAWVIQTLVKTLEEQYGFKVFFEDRDYQLGETIVDNIIKGIESSRRVIIVLSQSFLEGQWCGLEVQLIQKKLLKKLIVIKLDDVRDFELSPTLGWIIRERRYIEWNEHSVAQELFWEKINHAIEDNPDKPRLCAVC